MLKRWILLSLLVFVYAGSAFAISQSGITYQGRILRPDGSPLNGANVQFRLQIRTPNSSDCLMYEELKALDMRNSNGIFGLTINDGNGSRTDSTALGLDRIFGNYGNFTFDPATCASGSSYTPSVEDGRRLTVLFKDETMSTWEPIPAQTINYVPYAIQASQLAGFAPTSILRVQDAGGAMGNFSPLSNAQYTELLALVNGTSTRFSQLNGVSVPAMSTGEVLGWNGSAWVSQSVVGGANSVTSAMIQANAVDSTKLANGAVGTSQIASNVSIATSGTLASAITTTRDFKIFAASPSTFYVGMAAPALASSYTLTWPMTAGGTGQVLTTDGSGALTWTTPAGTGISALTGDVTASGTGSVAATVAAVGGSTAAQVHSAELAANAATSAATASTIVKRDGSGGFSAGAVTQTSSVYKDSALNTVTVLAPTTVSSSYVLKWPTAAGSAAQVLTTDALGNLSWTSPLSSSSAFVQGGNTFGAGAVLGTNDNFDLRLSTNGATAMTVATDGKIGIGTTAPNGILHISVPDQGWPAAHGGFFLQDLGSSAGYIQMTDGTGSAGQFEPTIEAKPSGGSRSFIIRGKLTGSGDVGTSPIVQIDATAAGATVVNRPLFAVSNAGVSKVTVDAAGSVGIGTTAPSTKLEVVGSLRVGDGGETCDATRTGAIRYNAGNLQFCAGAMPWTTLGTAGSGLTALTGDVTATGPGSAAATVAAVGGVTAANVATGANLANAATNLNTASTIVKRDASGNFAAGAITHTSSVFKDSGANTATIQAPTTIPSSYVLKLPTGLPAGDRLLQTDSSGNLSWLPVPTATGTAGGDLSGNYPNPTVATVGAVTAANIASGANLANAATALNTSNAIVKRDGTGNFAANVGTFNGVALNNAGSIVNLVNPVGAGYTLTLPTGTGSSGQVLTTDGTGILSWVAASTGSQWTTQAPGINYMGGNVGIGTTSAVSKLQVKETLTNASGNQATTVSTTTFTPAAGSTAGINGTQSNVEYTAATNSTSAIIAGVEGTAMNSWTGRIGGARGVSGYIGAVNGGTIDNGMAGFFQVIPTASTITNAYGVYTGTVNGTNKWSFYASDAAAPNYFAGNVGIGTNAPTGTLHVSGGTAASGNGVPITLQAQNAAAGNNNGGSIYLNPGTRTGTGSPGTVMINGSAVATGIDAQHLFASTFSMNNATSAMLSNSLTLSNIPNAGAVYSVTETTGTNFVAGNAPTSTLIGTSSIANNLGGGLGTLISGKFVASNTSAFSGTVTDARAGDFSVTRTQPISNGYGVYIGTVDATKKFSLYSNDATAPSYFAGSVGIGTTSPTSKLLVRGDPQVLSGNANPTFSNFTYIYPSGTTSATYVSSRDDVVIDSAQSYSAAVVRGHHSIVTNQNTSTVGRISATENQVVNATTGTVTTAQGATGYVENQSTGTIGTAQALYAQVRRTGTGPITTGYGVYIGNIEATTGYGVYQADATAKNYFNGSIGIGTTSPSYKLDVVGDINVTGNFKVNGTNIASGTGDFKADGSVPMTGQLLGLYGTNNNPGFGFNGDPDTGMYRSGANKLAFATAGNTAVTIDNAGLVGIGTTSPTANIHVASTTASVSETFEFPSAQYGGFDFVSGGQNRWSFAANGPTFGTAAEQNAFYIYQIKNKAGTNVNSYRFYIGDNGNVGVGTSAPNGKLDVKGAVVMSGSTSGYTGFQPAANAGSTVWTLPTADGSSGQLLSTNGSGVLTWASASAASQWTTQAPGINYMGGSVGIGTTSPATLFDVVGSALVETKVASTSTTAGARANYIVNEAAGTNATSLQVGVVQSPARTAYFNAYHDTQMMFSTQNTPRLTIANGTDGGGIKMGSYANAAGLPPAGGLIVSGSVGIGTSSPAGVFDVRGGTAASETSGTSINIYAQNAGSTSTFKHGGNINLMPGLRTGYGTPGRVGIGTTVPQGTLHVKGVPSSLTNFAVYPLKLENTTGDSMLAVMGDDSNYDYNGFFYNINGGTEDFYVGTIGTDKFQIRSGVTLDGLTLLRANGNVGIGTSVPTSKLEVNGTVVTTPNVGTGATVDLAKSNLHVLSSVGGTSITLNNMVNGGNYTIVVKDTTSRQYTFANCTTSKFLPANAPTTVGTWSMYTILALDNGGGGLDCMITWATGYQ